MASGSPMQGRAARFAMRLPVRFRPSGSTVWYPGHTENISCSGVLFRCRRPLPAYAPIQVLLQLPPELSGGIPVKVICSAYVSRTMEPEQSGRRLAVAAAFLEARPVREARPELSLPATAPKPPAGRRQTLHTLNNQLMVILGNCDLLLMREPLEDDVRQGLLRMKEAVRRAAAAMREI